MVLVRQISASCTTNGSGDQFWVFELDYWFFVGTYIILIWRKIKFILFYSILFNGTRWARALTSLKVSLLRLDLL